MEVLDPNFLMPLSGTPGWLERRSAGEAVCEKLAMAIASGVFRIGDPLPGERELASTFGVSRETVRGAVRMLAGCGILDVSHGSRTRVRSDDVSALKLSTNRIQEINRYNIEDVHKARWLVEQAVVADAAEKIDTATLEFLEVSLDQQAAAISDPIRFLICDRDFHTAIYNSSGNPLLSNFVIDLYGYVMGHRRQAMSQPGAIEQSHADHRAILAALKAHDSEATQKAFGRHLDRIYASTKSAVGPDRREGG